MAESIYTSLYDCFKNTPKKALQPRAFHELESSIFAEFHAQPHLKYAITEKVYGSVGVRTAAENLKKISAGGRVETAFDFAIAYFHRLGAGRSPSTALYFGAGRDLLLAQTLPPLSEWGNDVPEDSLSLAWKGATWAVMLAQSSGATAHFKYRKGRVEGGLDLPCAGGRRCTSQIAAKWVSDLVGVPDNKFSPVAAFYVSSKGESSFMMRLKPFTGILPRKDFFRDMSVTLYGSSKLGEIKKKTRVGLSVGWKVVKVGANSNLRPTVCGYEI